MIYNYINCIIMYLIIELSLGILGSLVLLLSLSSYIRSGETVSLISVVIMYYILYCLVLDKTVFTLLINWYYIVSYFCISCLVLICNSYKCIENSINNMLLSVIYRLKGCSVSNDLSNMCILYLLSCLLL